MSLAVYANGMSIACKVADGKTIAAFPDVCLSPPAPPVPPIPYPNTAAASDTTDGSKTVQIGGEEVMLKDKSTFNTSTGNEAATKSFGMGVVTHQITGKCNFVAWSMDVKFEGDNIPRHMDLMGHNEASKPPNTPPWMYADKMAVSKSKGKVCKDEKKKADKACESSTVKAGKRGNCSKECKKAQKCVLVAKKDDKRTCCPSDRTGHHLIEVHCFTATGGRAAATRLPGMGKYNDEAAPCVCASRPRHSGTHGILHAVQGQIEAAFASGPTLKSWSGAGALIPDGGGSRGPATSKWTYGQARDAGAFAHKTAFPHCNSRCIQKQLDDYHKKCGLKEDTPVRTDPVARSGGKPSPDQKTALGKEISRLRGGSTIESV